MKTLLLIAMAIVIDMVIFALIIPYVIKMIMNIYANRNRTDYRKQNKLLTRGTK